jgi:hypothetical protein
VHAPHAEATAAHPDEDGRRGGCRGLARRRPRAPAGGARRRGGRSREHRRPRDFEVSIERPCRRRAVRNDALLRTLARDTNGAPPPVDIGQVEADEFRYAKRRCIEQLGDRGIAHGHRVVACGTVGERPERVGERPLGDDARQCALRPRRLQTHTGIDGEEPASVEPGGEATGGCRPARDARAREPAFGGGPQPVAEEFQVDA